MGDIMKKILLTGLKPTGSLTLGNYIGAIKQMKEMQDEYVNYLFVADMHAITVPMIVILYIKILGIFWHYI